jgi:MFS family permease
LSAAGANAADRFHVNAATLSSFAVLQLLVYASMQIPVGILIDRFGPKRLIMTGGALMCVGQVALAFTTHAPIAVGARVIIGAGDSMTLLSVLRLVASWFPSSYAPVLTQVTGLLGQLGQIASVVPLVAILTSDGWTAAFGTVAALAFVATILVATVVRDSPVPMVRGAARERSILADLAASWREPGTRIGFFSHFSSPFSATAFSLLWGYPFLVSGQGLSKPLASTLFVVNVVVNMFAGPLVGRLVSAFPFRRSWIVLSIVGAHAMVWALVLTWPGRSPLALLVVLMVVLAFGGPGSMVGFDYARSFNPPERLGGATGIVNVAGFAAALVVLFLVGVILDAQHAGTPATYSLSAFRWAMAVQYPVWAVGVCGILWNRRKLKAVGE